MPDTQQLMDDAKCINSCVPSGMQLSILISIFAKIANMNTDPNALMDGARCIHSCVPDGMKMSVLISLADSMSTGGAPDSIAYSGPPVVNPPALQNIVVDVDGRQWQYYAGSWH